MTVQKSYSMENQEVASLITFTSSYEQKWKVAVAARLSGKPLPATQGNSWLGL